MDIQSFLFPRILALSLPDNASIISLSNIFPRIVLAPPNISGLVEFANSLISLSALYTQKTSVLSSPGGTRSVHIL